MHLSGSLDVNSFSILMFLVCKVDVSGPLFLVIACCSSALYPVVVLGPLFLVVCHGPFSFDSFGTGRRVQMFRCF